MHVLVIREESASRKTAQRLRAASHVPVILPLMRIVPRGTAIPDGTFDAIVFTSAFAPALFSGLKGAESLLRLPVFCVGDATASAARKAGFGDISSCGGSAQALADQLVRVMKDTGARILYPGARDKAFDLVAVAADSGFTITEFELYCADLVDPGQVALASALRETGNGAVLLHSARSAQHLGHLIEKHQLGAQAASLTFIAISENVAMTAKGALPAENFLVLVAKLPEEDAMLALIGT